MLCGSGALSAAKPCITVERAIPAQFDEDKEMYFQPSMFDAAHGKRTWAACQRKPPAKAAK
jgi:hypothetical protein